MIKIETFISLQECARLESVSYAAIVKRAQRGKYAIARTPRMNGSGTPLVEIALSSLTPAAQQRWREEQQAESRAEVIEDLTPGAPPWYVEYDFNVFIFRYRDAYDEASERVKLLRAYIETPRSMKGEALHVITEQLQADERTVRNWIQKIKEAHNWAMKQQLRDGCGYSLQYQAMALCRKPREESAFAGITDQMISLIENVVFDRELCRNRPPAELQASEVIRQAEAHGIAPIPDKRTIARYIQQKIMSVPENQAAYALASKGVKRFKNEHGIKTRRDTKELKVLEYVMGDEHTFDFWGVWTDASGRRHPARPTLITWIDVKSRAILGVRVCKHANSDELKRSLLKLVYEDCGSSVPRYLHTDNGKDYTAKAMTGRKRSERFKADERDSDAALKGFYTGLGIEDVTRSMPYEPWGKGQQERFYSRLNEQFSKRFGSYTGTLTGSRTDAKVPKDIKALFEAGKLMSFEQIEAEFESFIAEYHQAEHRGLREAGEEQTTPAGVFEHAERYKRPALLYESAVMLLLKDAPAYVHEDGIYKNKRRYMDYSLAVYIGKTVNIKYDPNKPDVIHVFDASTGAKICEAAEAKSMSFFASEEEVQAHKREQNRQIQDARRTIERMRMSYEERIGAETPKRRAASLPGLIKEGNGMPEVVALPVDRENNAELMARRQESNSKCFDFGEAFFADILQPKRRMR